MEPIDILIVLGLEPIDILILAALVAAGFIAFLNGPEGPQIALVLVTVVVGFIYVKQLNIYVKQLNVMKQQFLSQRSSSLPLVEVVRRDSGDRVKKVEFDENGNLELMVKNIGTGPALDMGILTSFYPFRRSPDEPSHVRDYSEKFCTPFWMRFKPNRNWVLSKPGQEPKVNTPLHTSTLEAGAEGGTTTELKFMVKGETAEKDFDELKRFLCEIGFNYCLIRIDFTYKDITEQAIDTQNLATFVVDLREHKTLSAAFSKKLPYNIDDVGINQYIDERQSLSLSEFERMRRNRTKST